MRKQLVSILLVLANIGLLQAKEFSGGGMEPFWDVILKHQNDELYQAVLSYPNETGITKVRGIVERYDHKDYSTYNGQGSDGKPLSIMLIEKPCVTEGKGDTLSHLVIVNQRFDGCGGDVLIDSDEGENDDTENENWQRSQGDFQKAKKLNTRGFRLYKQRKYYQALPLFLQATKADRHYALGYYNFACTASIVAPTLDCSQDESITSAVSLYDVIQALKKAVSLDPVRRERSKTDPDLALVRKSAQYYREVLGYSPNNNAEFTKILRRSVWRQGDDDYPKDGKPARLFFRANNVVEMRRYRGKDEYSGSPDRIISITGHYRVHNGAVTITLNDKSTTGRLTSDSDLYFPDAFRQNVLPSQIFGYLFPIHCPTSGREW
ncbi:hypothetical protein QJU89_02295 [Pasteurella skyensis]|uniref:Tetratricopeptide repeat-containing protein n=1 Tax=Phocoenobacter skyensis TaxID=97481 RepID=A0AAJ6N8Q3_9PAST|nr:hypothetical protein [Pasteurella skyensis]MDP8162395.1 hypothetical protein [Pasteurella skyensis]MDP8172271.1 hypothetical protein [Pasteurella skyensis]MDP8177095.1 hypothetical protein [Pasteurella skyensis]MDP8178526.1 hypothetical protein [Pasteurella skyensis]MDP8182528.1 hypothetical protein [Pasteurella skyensis]